MKKNISIIILFILLIIGCKKPAVNYKHEETRESFLKSLPIAVGFTNDYPCYLDGVLTKWLKHFNGIANEQKKYRNYLMIDKLDDSNFIITLICQKKDIGKRRIKSFVTLNWHDRKIDLITGYEDFFTHNPGPMTFKASDRPSRWNIPGNDTFFTVNLPKDYMTDFYSKDDIITDTNNFDILSYLLDQRSEMNPPKYVQYVSGKGFLEYYKTRQKEFINSDLASIIRKYLLYKERQWKNRRY